MKRVCNLLILSFFCLAASCDKDEPAAEKVDVQFEVPATMTVEEGASEISFRVQFSKAPLASDQIILGSGTTEYTCSITTVSETRFGVSIASAWSRGFGPGTYNVYHVRGTNRTLKGKTDITVKYPGDEDVKPADGSTVYGKVSCEGTGLAGVVVSDGIEVVKTDSKGVYQMKSKKYHGYVFVSTPSGYEPLVSGILPKFHATLKSPANVAERVDFQLKKADGQDNHRMLMLGDIHLARRTDDQKQFAGFVKDVNATIASTPGKVYALTLGDMTWDLYWITNNYSFKEYLADAAGIQGVMLYHTIGNHDHSMYYMGDYDTVKEYKELIGPTYYSFNIGKVHYVVLDDVECTNSTLDTERKDNAYVRTYDGHIVSDELNWLKKDLASVPNGTPLVVTMHIPLYSNKGAYNIKEASALENVLKAYPEVHLYTAHTHTVYNTDHLGTNHLYEHNAGSICGTWWWSGHLTPGVHIGQDGSPGGYTLLDIAGTDVKWQYKATGKGTDYQFVTYDRNQILLTDDKYVPSSNGTYEFDASIWGQANTSNEVYINVWNWDPDWKVEVSENGTPLKVSQIVSGEKDPLHLIAYTAKRINKNSKPTFKTEKNYHLFKVTASGPDTTLDIKVTDRFGNVYTETMTRPKAFNTDTYKF